MCLDEINEFKRVKKDFVKKRNLNSDVTFYKSFVVNKTRKILISPYKRVQFNHAGTYRETDPIQKKYTPRNIEFPATTSYFGGCYHGFRIKNHRLSFLIANSIPIRVKIKDIIAFGYDGEVCFKAFRIEKRTWDKIFK